MAFGAAEPGERQVFVGARKRLSDERRYGYDGELVVNYYDAEAEEWREVELCADGARKLARELQTWATMLESPRKARRRKR